MHFYKIFHLGLEDDGPKYRATLDDAKAEVRSFTATSWLFIRVELVEIWCGRDDLVQILNGSIGRQELLRTYKVTPRGALVECPNGE